MIGHGGIKGRVPRSGRENAARTHGGCDRVGLEDDGNDLRRDAGISGNLVEGIGADRHAAVVVAVTAGLHVKRPKWKARSGGGGRG